MRRLLVCVLLAASVVPPAAYAAVPITEARVRFHVVNTNTSLVPCPSDGLPYEIGGTIAAPAGALDDATAVTLYLHGSGNAEAWNFTGLPGYDFIGDMARAGHVGVYIHNLGYGLSDIPVDGSATCFGSLADITHQVIGELRSGDYLIEDVASPPAFERVALAGHSSGGALAEAESISYGDADAVVVAGWADFAPKPFLAAAVGRAAVTCLQGGTSKDDGGTETGYVYTFTRADHDKLFFNEEPAMFQMADAIWEREPCGLPNTIGQLVAVNALAKWNVAAPVLLVYGDRDVFVGGGRTAASVMGAQYSLTNPDVTTAVIRGAGHMLQLQRTAPRFRHVVARWLTEHGF